MVKGHYTTKVIRSLYALSMVACVDLLILQSEKCYERHVPGALHVSRLTRCL